MTVHAKDAECEARLGYQYQYDPKKKRAKTFRVNDCIIQSIPDYQEDKHGRFLKNVKTKYQCDSLKGIWDKKCWKTEQDSTCYSKDMEKPCNIEKGCRWSNNECVNESTIPGFLIPKDWPNDMTQNMLQDYLLRFFENRLDMKFPESQELISDSNRCASGELALTVPQNLLRYAMNAISNHATNRGLLVYHSTGSGKTVTAMAMIESLWDTQKHIVIASSVEGKANNPIARYFEVAQRFFPRFLNKPLEEIEKMFELRGVKYFSFAELSHFLLLYRPLQRVVKQGAKAIAYHSEYLKNGVIFIDEVHNIFRPLPTQKQENQAVKDFLLEDRATNENMKMVILTATPGNNIQDTIDLLNMIRDRTKPIIEAPSDLYNQRAIQNFKRSIRGLISYFDMSSDLSKFPKVYYRTPYHVPMSHAHYEAYKIAKSENELKENNFDLFQSSNSLQKYMKTARRYSNSLYTFPTNANEAVLEDFSCKVPKLLSVLQALPKEKHYVYTAFYENRGFGGQGAVMIGKFLETELGYLRLTCNEAFKNTITKQKRYVILTSSFLTSKKSKNAAKNLQALMDIYNAPQNSNGEYIHTIIASQGYNEGLDLKDTRHIHLFDPLVTYAMEKQTTGRAVRQCSHANLDKSIGQWTVQVHRYFSDKPENMDVYDPDLYHEYIKGALDEMDEIHMRIEDIKGKRGEVYKSLRTEYKDTYNALKTNVKTAKETLNKIEEYDLNGPDMIDDIIFKESRERMKELLIIHQAIKDAAIDCKVLKDFHTKSGIQIDCLEKDNNIITLYKKVANKVRGSTSSKQ